MLEHFETPREGRGAVLARPGLARSGLCALLAALSIAPAAGSAPAPAPDLRFERFSIDRGLSQSSVYAILQDEIGFLWLGTEDGLNRYDGYRFEVLRNRPNDADSLSHSNVRALHEDRSGHLWIGTRNGGLNRYDRQTGTFTRYPHDPAVPGSLAHNLVRAIHQDRAGTLWIGTGGGGLDRFEVDAPESAPGTATFTHFRHDPDDPASLSHDFVQAVHEDRTGRLWVGTRAGLDRLDRETLAFSHHRLEPEEGDAALYNNVSAIVESREGHFWLGTRGGLVRFDPEASPAFRFFRHHPDRPNSPRLDRVRDVLEDSGGRLWLTAFGGGLLLFDPATASFSRYRHDANDPDSLSGDRATVLYEDRSGTFWIGTSAAGLNKLRRSGKAFAHVRRDPAAPSGLSDDMIFALHESLGGILWIGTWNGGLNRLDRATGAVEHYRAKPEDPARLASDDVRAVLETTSGDLWVGTEGGGLHRLDAATGTFRRYRHDPEDERTLRDADAWVLYEDRDRALWVGTYGGGLSRYLPDTDDFTHYRHHPDDPSSLSHDVVRAVCQDAAGSLWVGTGGGLNRLDPGSGGFTRFRQDEQDSTSLSSNAVLTILEGRDGSLWVGTGGGGLNRLVPGPEGGSGAASFRLFTTDDGLASNMIYAILEDEEGRLWMSTNRGLSRFDPAAETFRNFDVTDGLQSNEFNTGAAFKSHGGEMFFGGIHGVNAFFPDRIEDNPYVPPVVLTSIKKFNQEVSLASDLATLPGLTLRHDESVVSFEFAALSYTVPEKNRYAYRLAGFREPWTDLGTKRDVTFTNLDPGAYTLQVMGSNNDGVWNEEGLRLKLTVEPPFWRTWWFKASAALAAAGLLWGGYLVRTRSIRRHNLALQAEIAERRRAEEERERLIAELETNNLELEARNAEMERFTYTVSHDLKTPLVTIRGFVGMLRRDVADGNAERVNADLERISSAADTINLLMQDLLELSRVGRQRNPPETVALSQLAEEALAQLSDRIAERAVDVALDPDMPTVSGDRPRLLEVYQNLVDNAVKFMGDQEAPRVEIGTRADGDGTALCWVRDNGAGVDPRYGEKIFRLFERLDQQVQGTGVGLALVKRIVEVHGGRAWVESEGAGRGSTFYFTLPLTGAASHGDESP